MNFEDWANQEMQSHGSNVSFKDWLSHEVKKHENATLKEWGRDEMKSHNKRYGAEGKKFSVYGGRGFQIVFENGYKISVMFGVGNYADHHRGEITLEQYQNPPLKWESRTAEVAVFKPNGDFVRIGANDDVAGWLSPSEVSRLIAATATGDETKIEQALYLDNKSAEDSNMAWNNARGFGKSEKYLNAFDYLDDFPGMSYEMLSDFFDNVAKEKGYDSWTDIGETWVIGIGDLYDEGEMNAETFEARGNMNVPLQKRGDYHYNCPYCKEQLTIMGGNVAICENGNKRCHGLEIPRQYLENFEEWNWYHNERKGMMAEEDYDDDDYERDGWVKSTATFRTVCSKCKENEPQQDSRFCKECEKSMGAESGQMCEVCFGNDDMPYDSDHFTECRRCGKSVCIDCEGEMEHHPEWSKVCAECSNVLDNVHDYGAETFEGEREDYLKWLGNIWYKGSSGNEDFYGECYQCGRDLNAYDPGYVASERDFALCMPCFGEGDTPKIMDAEEIGMGKTIGAIAVGGAIGMALFGLITGKNLFTKAKDSLKQSAEAKKDCHSCNTNGSIRKNHTQVLSSEYSVGQINPVEVEGQNDVHGAEGITNPRHAPNVQPDPHRSKSLRMW